MDTDERMRLIEARLEAVEHVIEDAKVKLAAFTTGPGRKILATLGVKLNAG